MYNGGYAPCRFGRSDVRVINHLRIISTRTFHGLPDLISNDSFDLRARGTQRCVVVYNEQGHITLLSGISQVTRTIFLYSSYI